MMADFSQASQSDANWHGRIDLRFIHAYDRTRLRREAGYGPLYVQKPFYPEGDVAHVYLLHPPGGVKGGDHLDVIVSAAQGAHALITTPAATKFYRSNGPVAELQQTLYAASGASIEWLPQETLFFGGAQASVSTSVRLGAGARFIGWETFCLGREASGDRFGSGAVNIGLNITRVDPNDTAVEQPLLRDRVVLNAGSRTLTAPWGLAGQRALAVIYATPCDPDDLRTFRARHGSRTSMGDLLSAATLIEDLLIYRVLGSHLEPVRNEIEAAWETLRPLVMRRPPSRPRIWNT